MHEVMIIILAYIAGGLVTASVMACALKNKNDHLTEYDWEILVWVFTFWPVIVLVGIVAAPIFAAMAMASALYKHVKWVRRLWDSLPDRSGLYPVEWLLCWPVKLTELWRKRNKHKKESSRNGLQEQR